MSSVERSARRQQRIEKGLLAASVQTRLAYSSIDGGALVLRDLNGDLQGVIGQQWDGTTTVASVGGTPPPPPMQPLVTPRSGGLAIYWDGSFADGSPTRMDFRRVTFHAVTNIDDMDPLNAGTIVGEITTATGGEVFALLPPVEHFVYAVAWTDSGKFSVESAVAFGTPLSVVDQAQWEEHEAKLDELNDVTLPALEVELAANQAAIDALANIDLSAFEAELDANAAAIATLQGTTLPALQSELDASQIDITTMQDTTLPALQSELAANQAAVTAAATAANDAAAAATASSKFYVQTATPTGRTQDLWIDTTGGANTPKRWNGSAWVAATDKAATDAAAAVTALGGRVTTAEGKITTAEGKITTAEGKIGSVETRMTTAEGNITSTSSAVSNLNGTVTSHTTRLDSAEGTLTSIDGRVDTAEASITSHTTRLDGAESSITDIVNVKLPGKNKSTYSTSVPGTAANVAGDIWFQKVGGEIIGQWQGNGGTSWTKLTMTDAMITNLNAGTITAGTLAAAVIGAGTIDSTKIVTAGLDAGTIKFGTMSGDRIAAGTIVVGQVNGLQGALDAKETPAGAQAKATAAQNAATTAASLDATTKADAAQIAALEKAWLSNNSTFTDWTASAPAGFFWWGTGTNSKNTIDARTGPYAAQIVTDSTNNSGLQATSSVMSALPVDVEYITVEVDVMLKAGTFNGAGVLFDWAGLTPLARDKIIFKDIVPSPVIGKMYRITKVLQRPSGGTGTQTGYGAYMMANYPGDGLGTLSVKTIVFDRFAVRPASQEEIAAKVAGEWRVTGTTTIDGGRIATDSIDSAQINAGAITAAKIGALAVTAGKVAADAITATEIAAGAITASEIATGAVTAGKIFAGAVTATEIASDAITTAKIAAGAVTATEIATGAITTEKLTVGSLGGPLVGNGGFEDPGGWTLASSATRIAAAARSGGYGLRLTANASSAAMANLYFPVAVGDTISVTAWAKQITATTGLYLRVNWRNAAGTVLGNSDSVANQSTTTSWARYGGSVTASLAGTTQASFQLYNVTGTVDIDDIDVRQVLIGVQIADDAITANKIAANAITANEIAADAITASELAANAVTANEIAADAVTAGKIAANAITAREIAADTITAAEIAAGAITATELNATALTGKTIRTATFGERLEINTDVSSASKIQFFSGLAEEAQPATILADSFKTDTNNVGTAMFMAAPGLSGTTGQAQIEVSAGRGVNGLGRAANRVEITASGGTANPGLVRLSAGSPTIELTDPVGTSNDKIILSAAQVTIPTGPLLLSGNLYGSTTATQAQIGAPGLKQETGTLGVRMQGGIEHLGPYNRTAFTPGGGWTNLGGNNDTCAYVLENGVVYLEGLITTGTTGATIFNLPAAVRPTKDKHFAVAASNNVVASVAIRASDGAIIVNGTGTGGNFMSIACCFIPKNP